MEHQYENGVCVTCGPEAVRAEPDDLVCHACAGPIDLETAALLTALNELDGISRAIWDESKHPRGHSGKFRSLADHLKEAIQAHRESGGAGPHPLHGYNREQLRRVAKARGVQLDRGESHESIRDKLMGHFGGHHEAGAGHPSGDAEARIRAAYDSVAPHPGAWVKHTDVRKHVSDVPDSTLSDAFRRLGQAHDVEMMPESNQKTLTAADREHAVWVGGQHTHLMSIRKNDTGHSGQAVEGTHFTKHDFNLWDDYSKTNPAKANATPEELKAIREKHPVKDVPKVTLPKKRTEAEIRQDLNHSGGFDVVAGSPKKPAHRPLPLGNKLTDEHLKSLSTDELVHHIGRYSHTSATGKKLRAESSRRTTEAILNRPTRPEAPPVPDGGAANALTAAAHELMQGHSSSPMPIQLGVLANKIRSGQVGPAEAAAETRKLRDSLPDGPERKALTGLLGSMGGIKPPRKATKGPRVPSEASVRKLSDQQLENGINMHGLTSPHGAALTAEYRRRLGTKATGTKVGDKVGTNAEPGDVLMVKGTERKVVGKSGNTVLLEGGGQLQIGETYRLVRKEKP